MTTAINTDDVGLAALLGEHHRELDQRLAALVTRAQGGAPVQLRCEWSAFERELLAHLDLEEAQILPAFARHDALVEQLRAHARHEEQALYAWTRRNVF